MASDVVNPLTKIYHYKAPNGEWKSGTFQMAKRNQRKARKIKLFLEALSKGTPVAVAAQAAGIAHRTVYEWRDADSDFRERWEEAYAAGTDVLEQEARRRAFEGVDEEIYFHGQICGRAKRYSDPLLMFLLKARDPKYKDRVATEISGSLSLTHEQWLAQLATPDDPIPLIAEQPETAAIEVQDGAQDEGQES